MARVNGSGFKMKGSPLKNKLGDILRSVGVDLKAGQKDRGMFSEKGKAEKKSRKAGESKYQADIRRKREAKKADKPRTDILTKNIKDTSQKGDEAVRPKKATVANKPKSKGDYMTFSGKPGDKYKYRTYTGTGDDLRYEFQRPGSDAWETSKTKTGTTAIEDLFLQEYEGQNIQYSPIQKKSPTKKSGFKMKNSPAKIYDTKGKRRKNYKY